MILLQGYDMLVLHLRKKFDSSQGKVEEITPTTEGAGKYSRHASFKNLKSELHRVRAAYVMLNQNKKVPLRCIGSILNEEIDKIISHQLYCSF